MPMKLILYLTAALVLAVPTIAVSADVATPTDPAALEFFEKKVRPILANNCYNCHSADHKASGGLRVDDRHGLLQGGERGAAVVPGKPDESWLLKAVRQTDELKMPPDSRLADEEVAILTKWVEDGAAWPVLDVPADLLNSDPTYDKLRANHWAWQPLKVVSPPAVTGDWARHDIDRFILQMLQASGIQPVGDAPRKVLIRRLSFDLTGLPPSPEEIEQFVADDSPQAVEMLVDRLLASEAFGERWGRHWLDIARFGESTGSSRNMPYPHAWRYRDYVIDSFNKNKPYDQFIREQIAGDLLPANSPAEKSEQLIATGFLALGVKDVNQRFEVRYVMDNIDEQIDTVTRSVLAVTASCARCHDHKFDPIPSADYYALAGIFKSTQLCDALRSQMGGSGLVYYVPDRLIRLGDGKGLPDGPSEKIEEARKALKAAQAELAAFRKGAKNETRGPERQAKMQSLRETVQQRQAELSALTDPASQGPVALGVREAETIADTEIRLRGEAEKLGPVVPRGYLTLLHSAQRPAIPEDQSGRLELARWLTSKTNPLTPRVIVNRIWQHLFEEGLVATVDNFGVTGATPTHPELLDYLADQFVREGWSIKTFIRQIVLTRTYQLSSEATPENLRIDPANRLVWRHPPRRLDAEELRDTMLATAGRLDRTRPSGSPAQTFLVREFQNNGKEAKIIGEYAAASTHRSVYLPLLRGLVPNVLQVFDFAEQGMVTGRRENTTIAPQALYLLNDSFVRRQALTLGERLLGDSSLDDARRIERVYQLVLGRQPSAAEQARAQSFLTEFAAEAQQYLPETPASGEALASTVAAASSQTGETTEAPKAVSPNATPANNKPNEGAGGRSDDVVLPSTPQAAAWMSLVQALYASAEFRYLQ